MQKVQPALTQPASLLRKPASVSIATARDGEYHSTAAWPVSHVPTQHAGQAEAEDPRQPSCPADTATVRAVTVQPGFPITKVQSMATVLSFQSELHHLGLCWGARRQRGEGFSPLLPPQTCWRVSSAAPTDRLDPSLLVILFVPHSPLPWSSCCCSSRGLALTFPGELEQDPGAALCRCPPWPCGCRERKSQMV